MATNRHEEFASDVRQTARRLWESHQHLKALKDEYAAQDFGNPDPEIGLIIDPAGPNGGITPGELGAVLYATNDAIAALMAAGHATNITAVL